MSTGGPAAEHVGADHQQVVDRPRSVVAWMLIGIVRGYQLVLSPLLGPRCRFYPSCSSYALQAVQKHGAARGSWLAVRRLGRCHPWNPGGVDHVPPARRPSPTFEDCSPC